MTPSPAELDQLFIQDVPLIDVRAPVEFDRGAFPQSINLPILNNEEREQVGICYKAQGPAAASELGHRLVSDDLRNERITAWSSVLKTSPGAALYCARGGQRSGIAADWLSQNGVDVIRIEGGYKRMRAHLIKTFENLPPLLIVAGKTGTGKTEFLSPYADTAIDLEAIANHRGSAFGGYLDPQPSQINFENTLAVEFLKKGRSGAVILEDEGRLIGRIHLPLPLQAAMKQAPLLLIEESVDSRAERILQEYIVDQWQAYHQRFGDTALEQFTQYLFKAVDAIRKRLGNVAHAEVRAMVTDALVQQADNEKVELHRLWIRRLLTDYYDPMYEYQLEKKLDRVAVRGSHETLGEWLMDHQEMNV